MKHLILALLIATLAGCHGHSSSESLPAAPPDFRKSYTRAPVAEFAASTSRTPIPPDVAVYFERDSDQLTAEARDELDAVAGWLDRNPASNVAVAGHADRLGTSAYNLTLSIRRARVVREYLVRIGADARRIVSFAYGEYKANATPGVCRRVVVYAIQAGNGAALGTDPGAHAYVARQGRLGPR